MKVTVLNGSPKGELSITLQYVHFLQNKFSQHELKIFHVSQRIKRLETDEKAFQEIIEEVSSSDAILWAFGVFVLAAPSQCMRFVDLIYERGVEDAFKGKYAAVLTTSIHFFDHTAHNYMRAVCEDLNMIYADGLSLYLQDLTDKKRRRDLTTFAENFFEAIEKRFTTARLFKPIAFSDFVYEPSSPEKEIATKGKKIVILTDGSNSNSNLGKMIARFMQPFTEEIETIDLNDIDIRGGCLGCMRCGYDYKCVQRDGFTNFYNSRVMTADIIVFAGEVRGPYLSSKWKEFYDRAFFWNHTPSLVGKQLGYIISGPLSHTPNLIQILEASSTTRQDAILQSFALRLVSFAEKGYVRPQNFLGVGGHKVFRDDIWGRLRMIWQADHRYYKKHDKYDFPQKELKLWIANPIMMSLTKIPIFRKKFYMNITKFSSGRLKKIAERKD